MWAFAQAKSEQQQRPDRRSKITQIKEVAQALATIRRDLSDPVTQVLCSDYLYSVILLGVAHNFGKAIETSPFPPLPTGVFFGGCCICRCMKLLACSGSA